MFLPSELIVLILELSPSFDPIKYLILSKSCTKMFIQAYSNMKVLKTNNLDFSRVNGLPEECVSKIYPMYIEAIAPFPHVEHLTITSLVRYRHQSEDYEPMIPERLVSLDISNIRYYPQIESLTSLITHVDNIGYDGLECCTNLKYLELIAGISDSIDSVSLPSDIENTLTSLKLVGLNYEESISEQFTNLTSLDIDNAELQYGIPIMTSLTNLTLRLKKTWRDENFEIEDIETGNVQIDDNGILVVNLPESIKMLTIYSGSIMIESKKLNKIEAHHSKLFIHCPALNILNLRECEYEILKSSNMLNIVQI